MCGVCLPYDTLTEVRSRLEEIAPHLIRYGSIETANYSTQALELLKVIVYEFNVFSNFITYKKILNYVIFMKETNGSLSSNPLEIKQKTLDQFFMTDVISRASLTMAKCVQAVLKQRESSL